MTLLDLIERPVPPTPWAEGAKIPWDDPAFSERMLSLHLSQEHDWASRRFALVDQHVDWIEDTLLPKQARILDLGCGPGLYTQRLASRGHRCRGLDIGPASIRYAREQAEEAGLAIDYELQDVRGAQFGESLDLVMMLFGEFNLFSPEDAQALVRRACQALRPGGHLLIEGHTCEEVMRQGGDPSLWQASEQSVFADYPHLWLEEHFWDEAADCAITRYLVVDARDGSVSQHSSTMQAYTDDQMTTLFQENGFGTVKRYDALAKEESRFGGRLQVLTARRESE